MQTEIEVEEFLRTMRFSVPVKHWHVEFDEDHQGDPAIFVWATLEPADLNGDTRHEVRTGVWEALMHRRELGIEWAYVRFREVGEEQVR